MTKSNIKQIHEITRETRQDHTQLFDEDKEALMKDLHALPRTSLLAKLNYSSSRVSIYYTKIYYTIS